MILFPTYSLISISFAFYHRNEFVVIFLIFIAKDVEATNCLKFEWRLQLIFQLDSKWPRNDISACARVRELACFRQWNFVLLLAIIHCRSLYLTCKRSQSIHFISLSKLLRAFNSFSLWTSIWDQRKDKGLIRSSKTDTEGMKNSKKK